MIANCRQSFSFYCRSNSVKYLLIIFCIFLTANCSIAQIGINTALPDSSAVLDISSTTKGVLYPRMTTGDRNAIASPAFGLMIFNITTGCINIFNGLAWLEICGALPSDHQYIDAIYVSTNGDNGTGDGSPQNPYASMSKAYQQLSVQDKDTIVMAGGEYFLGTLIMNNDTGKVILGGFEEEYWTQDISTYPTNIDSGPGSHAIISQSHNIYIRGINFIQSTSTEFDAAYGLCLYESIGIIIEDCNLYAGPGPDGLDGDPGAPGTPSTPGSNSNGNLFGANGGSIGGGNGGDGGIAGAGEQAGQPGNGGAPGGVADGGNGSNGTNGINGANGSGGSLFGFPSTFYEPAAGEDGTDGWNGTGGGGGGGSEGSPFGSGDGGGGGGGAGGGGAHGFKGLGGGGSFGLYAFNSTVTLTNCTLESSDGGDGGDGGNGGPGAAGSPGGTDNDDGGDGGSGGNGGNGGHGGGGGGGPSYAAFSAGTSSIVLTNVTLIHGAPGAGGSSMGSAGLNGIAADKNFN